MNILFPANMPNSVVDITFDKDKFSIYTDYDTMLRLEYGNYLELPPETERICKHIPKKIVF